MRDDIRRNGDGYVDVTAYMALRKVIKEESRMEYKAGDIVDISTTNGDRTALIINGNKDYATIGMLFDSQRECNNVAVSARHIMYMDAGRLAYVYWDKVIGLVRTASEIQFASYMGSISKALGLDKYVEPKTVPEIREASRVIDMDNLAADLTDALRKEIREVIEDCIPVNVANQEATDEVIRAKAERDVYKGLYENLLMGLIPKKVG